jgi:orotidine-5'-phosphate decarboxylase
MTSFQDLIAGKWEQKKFVCLGLDPDYTILPKAVKKPDSIEESILLFNLAIIDATADLVCAFKPNSAFYEAYGTEGWSALKKTCDYLKSTFPQIPVILDAKRGDIESTNSGYTKMAFEYLNTDAITIHPYLGQKAIQPFLDYKAKGIFILVKTSNPGSDEFQNLTVKGQKMYEHVARQVVEKWNSNNNCALVVGAPYPDELADVREIAGEMPILIPGIGKQGGSVAATVKAGKSSSGGMIINSSRAIIYASAKKDFAHAARIETQKLHNQILKNYA